MKDFIRLSALHIQNLKTKDGVEAEIQRIATLSWRGRSQVTPSYQNKGDTSGGTEAHQVSVYVISVRGM